ncbi:AsmA family protein [Vibrio rarus]|uniref:AsmA family protein n=1 Tax=Vibrio rarus TaxID=413403 RepID=UPI0021C37ACA|nr:AsmA family protein [Vibrio rarus]
MKAILKISAGLLLLLLISGIALFLFLQTSHSTWLTQQILSRMTTQEIHIEQSNYQYPDKLTLSQVTLIQANDTAIAIDKAQFTFQAHWDWTKPLSITHVLISGVNLPNGLPQQQRLNGLMQRWQPQHIEVRGLDFANHDVIARDIHINYTPMASYTEGYAEIDSEQVYWNGEAFNQFKARLNYSKNNTQLNLLSFNWRNGDVQLIAEQKGQHWTINDLLIRNLDLSQSLFQQSEPAPWSELLTNIDRIQHMDIERFSWQQNDFTVQQMHLQLNNWDLKATPWMQQADVNFSAESLVWHDRIILEPQVTAQLQPQKIQLNQLRFLFEQGQFHTSGTISPHQVSLNELSIKNLEWSIKEPQFSALIQKQLRALEQLSIDKVNIERSQIIDLSNDHHWQLSNLNVDGQDLILKQHHQWALWHGSLAASANSFTALGITSIKPYLETQTVDGLWRIKQLFLPIDKGLIKANSQVNLALISYPWKMSLQAYGIPLNTLTQPLDIAVNWQGLIDISAQLNGLGGDELMLKHTIDGQVKLAPHDVLLSLPFSEPSQHKVIIPEMAIKATRGIISVSDTQFVSNTVSGEVQGEMDLADPDKGHIQFNLASDCVSFSSILPKGRSQIAMTCPSTKREKKAEITENN